MTAPLPHQALFNFTLEDTREQKRPLKLHSASYVVSLGIHLRALAALMAAPFIEAGYEPEQAIVTPRPSHVVLYYTPTQVRPSPPTVAERRLPPIIVPPKPHRDPAVAKPKTFTAPVPPVIAAAIRERAPDISQAPTVAEPPPEKPVARAAKPALVQTVKVGSFGDPNGILPAPESNSRSLIAKVGAFDTLSSSGSGRVSGNGRSGALQTGAFGDGTSVAGSSSAGFGSTHIGGFSDGGAGSAAPPKQRQQPQVVASTPLEILSHPKPTYSQEARQRKVEGVVDLEVLFRANGEIQVLRVVHGLGHGLDEAAEQVAAQIRFRPGTRDGVPVDSKTIVHVTFELT
jgi:TonB family protein